MFPRTETQQAKFSQHPGCKNKPKLIADKYGGDAATWRNAAVLWFISSSAEALGLSHQISHFPSHHCTQLQSVRQCFCGRSFFLARRAYYREQTEARFSPTSPPPTNSLSSDVRRSLIERRNSTCTSTCIVYHEGNNCIADMKD